METDKKYLFHIIAVITVIIWGTTFVSTKVLINSGLSPIEIFLYRFILAYICIWFVSPKILTAKSIKDEFLFLLAGLCGGSLYFIGENTALGITLASNVSLIVCTSPILTALLVLIFSKEERIRKSLVIGSLMAFIGVALVVFNGHFILKISPIGDLLSLFAALMWAFYCLILKRLGNAYSTLLITRKVFFYGIVSTLPALAIQKIKFDYSVVMQPVVIANLLFLGVIASMICYIMWNASVKRLGALRATNYIYIIPLVAMITSRIVINEIITVIAIAGSILILCGVYISEHGFSRGK